MISISAFSQDIAYVDSVLNKLDADDTSNVHLAIEVARISKKLGYTKGEARAYHKLGYIYQNKEAYGLALTKYKQSMMLRERTGEQGYVAMLLVNCAYVFHAVKDFDKEVSYAEQALKFSTTDTITSYALLSLAKAYISKNNPIKAIEYLKKSATYKVKLSSYDKIYKDFLEIGNSFCKLGEYDSAISYYYKAEEFSKNDPFILSKVFNDIGVAYHFQNQLTRAEFFYNRSISCRSTNELGCAFLNIAELNFQKGNKNIAESYLDSAVKYPHTLEHYAKTLEAMNKNDRAMKAYKNLYVTTITDYEQILPYHAAVVDAEYREHYREQVETNKALYEAERKIKFAVILISILILGLVSKYLWKYYHKVKSARRISNAFDEMLKTH